LSNDATPPYPQASFNYLLTTNWVYFN